MTETRDLHAPNPVDFPTRSRPHIALPVRDLDRSVAYYSALLGRGPTKRREGYAKFEVEEPPLNLALNETRDAPTAPHPTAHFGVQVKSTEEVVAHHGRLRAAGFSTMNEEGVTCCFAVQDKVWTVDPDGNRWEVFVVLDDGAEVHSGPQQPAGRLPTDPSEPAPAVDATVQGGRGKCCP